MNGKNQITNTGFCYDSAGNLLGQVNCSTYVYDAENPLKQTAGVTYTYDGDGERVAKSSGVLYWGGSAKDALAESDASGTLTHEYIFFNGKRIARLDLPGGVVSYYFSDHLGSSNVITDAAGNITSESDFYPFGGERVVLSDGGVNHYKFTGKERDDDGLDNFGARHYASPLGRFLQPDEFKGGPVDLFDDDDPAPPDALPYAEITDPQSLNKYAYTYNNPLRYVDPDGHDIKDVIAGVLNATANDVAGTPRADGNQDFRVGQLIGDVATTLVAAHATIAEAAGFAYVDTQSGGVAAVATGTEQVVVVAATATVAVNAARNLPNSLSRATEKPYNATPQNVDKMGNGKAPTGKDGHPVELHHPNGDPRATPKEMTRTDHRLGGNYRKNHPNTNQQSSRINRGQAAQQRREHWKSEASKVKGKDQ